jgi:hypothetical protein
MQAANARGLAVVEPVELPPADDDVPVAPRLATGELFESPQPAARRMSVARPAASANEVA